MSDILNTILELDENVLAAILLLIGCVVAYFVYFREETPVVVAQVKTVRKAPTFRKPQASKSSGPRANNHLTLFFGSQTGTAEDFARSVAKDAKALGFETCVVDMEDYDHETCLKDEKMCLFFMATYGEGEPTDNAKDFWDWLQEDERENDAESFCSLQYAVFGLGNKTYEHYNSVGKYVDKRLKELGSSRVVDLGLGDDDSSLEDDFAAWRENLLAPFCRLAGIKPKVLPTQSKRGFVASFVLQRHEADSKESNAARLNEAKDTGGVGSRDKGMRSSKNGVFDVRNPMVAKIVVNRELHTERSDRSCRHIEIETDGMLTYEAGDHVGVFAENDPQMVESLAARLNLDLDEVVSLVEPDTRSGKPKVVLGPSSLRHIFLRLVEPCAPIRQSTLAALALYTSDEKDKAKLRSWSKDSDLYKREVKEACRTIPELLKEMPSMAPPLGVLLELLPRLAPRYYSLSSAPSAHGSRLHVTAIVVRHKTSTGRVLDGLCTSWFARVSGQPDVPVACFVRNSNFKLPKDINTPMLMIGPGTGIAPFRGFLHDMRERRKHAGSTSAESSASVESSMAAEAVATQVNDQTGHPAAVLYYGCRRRDTDALYPAELEAAVAEGVISELHVAESRLEDHERLHKHRQEKKNDEGPESPPPSPRAQPRNDEERTLLTLKYVQHHLSQPNNTERAAELLADPQARLYICGDARVMAKDVHEALKRALATHPEHMRKPEAVDLPMDKRLEMADQYLTTMTKEGRYLKDVWS